MGIGSDLISGFIRAFASGIFINTQLFSSYLYRQGRSEVCWPRLGTVKGGKKRPLSVYSDWKINLTNTLDIIQSIRFNASRSENFKYPQSKPYYHDRTCKRNPQTIHRRELHTTYRANLLSGVHGRNDRWTIPALWVGTSSVSKKSSIRKLKPRQAVTDCLPFFYGRTSQNSAFSLVMHRQRKRLAKRNRTQRRPLTMRFIKWSA